jgi:hypothetical protein
MSDEKPSGLLDLAMRSVSSAPLSHAEQMIFRLTEKGHAAILFDDPVKDDPVNAMHWDRTRVVRAECIEWLCTHTDARKFVTHRGIEIEGIRIDGDLDLRAASIPFPLWISRCAFTGQILLRDANLLLLSLRGCHVRRFFGDNLHIRTTLFLRNDFRATGELRLNGARIGDSLVFDGAKLSNPSGVCLNGDGLVVGSCAFFRCGFESEGQIRLVGANVGVNLEFDCSQAMNPNGESLAADGIRVGGGVYFRDNFRSVGRVRLVGANIGQNLECHSSSFRNRGGDAFTIEGGTVNGKTLIRGGSQFEGQLTLASAKFASLQISELGNMEHATIDLRSAKAVGFWDDEKSWPKPNQLGLDGFEYERFDGTAPVTASKRINWIQRQPRDRFIPQPYEQAASVLKTMGHDLEARAIMIEKNREHSRFTRLFRQRWWWYNVFGRAIGYGYAPWRAFAASIAVIVVGAFVFALGFSADLISPIKETAEQRQISSRIVSGKRHFAEDYPVFNPTIYSIEAFIPLLRLEQTTSWEPNANRGHHISIGEFTVTTGQLIRYYLWIHTISGWILTSLWIGAITGLVKS